MVDTDPVSQSNYSRIIRWSIPSRSPATPRRRWMLGHIKKIQKKITSWADGIVAKRPHPIPWIVWL